MNKIVSLFVLACLTTMFSSCITDDEPMTNNPNEEMEELSFSDSLLVWQHLKGQDSLQYSFNDPFFYDGMIIMHKNVFLTGTVDDVIYALDAENGELIWEWNDWIEYPLGGNTVRSFSYSSNKMFFESRDRTYCIDMNTGETIWENQDSDIGINGYPLTGWRNYSSYISTDYNIGNSNKSIYLHNLASNEANKVYTLSDELLEADLAAPNFELNEDSEAIMFISGSLADGDNYDGTNGTHYPVFMAAFNTSSQEYVWKKEAVAFWNVVRKNAPIVLEHSIILTTHNKVMSFDKKTGDILWDNQFDLSFTSCNYIFGNGKIFVRDNLSNTYGIDAETGDILWQNTSTSRSSFCGMSVYEDHLYVGTHNIDIVNINTGETEYTIEPHNEDSDSRAMFLFAIPALSDDGRFIYTSDTFYDICYRNPVYN